MPLCCLLCRNPGNVQLAIVPRNYIIEGHYCGNSPDLTGLSDVTHWRIPLPDDALRSLAKIPKYSVWLCSLNDKLGKAKELKKFDMFLWRNIYCMLSGSLLSSGKWSCISTEIESSRFQWPFAQRNALIQMNWLTTGLKHTSCS